MVGRIILMTMTAFIAATLLGTHAANHNPGARQPNEQPTTLDSPVMEPDSIRGSNGELIGTAHDPRIRLYFKNNGLPQ
jgi:hypothetical protein